MPHVRIWFDVEVSEQEIAMRQNGNSPSPKFWPWGVSIGDTPHPAIVQAAEILRTEVPA